MAITGGFTGKVLRVDLTARTATTEATFPRFNLFWGGHGAGYKVIWDEVPNTVNWWDAANRIAIFTGPATGSSAPCSGRGCATSLGPVHCTPDSITGIPYPGSPTTISGLARSTSAAAIQVANGPVNSA